MDIKAIKVKSRVILGLLWIIAGALMILNKKVSFGSIELKLDGLGLYVISIGIILMGIYMIFARFYSPNENEE